MIEETLYFSSANNRIEARLAYAESTQSPVAKVLLCSPHPFMGGDMDNNVLTHIAKQLVTQGFMVFRFNYRGIGMSETDRDLQEDQKLFWENSSCPLYEENIHIDCREAYQTLSAIMQSDWPIFIIGYSFGCLPSIQIAKDHGVKKLGLISPPISKWKLNADDLGFIPKLKLFYAPDDFACPESDIQELYKSLSQPASIQLFPDSDHFFIGQEAALANAVANYLMA